MPSPTSPVIISRGVTRHARFIRREPSEPELHPRQLRRRKYHTAPSLHDCSSSTVFTTAAVVLTAPSCVGSHRRRHVVWRATRHDGHWLGRRRVCWTRQGTAAPPDIRNGPQKRLGVSTGVNLAAREREAAAPRIVRGNLSITWTRGRAYVMSSAVIDDVICGQSCDGCCNGARENVIASVIGRLVGQVW